MNCDTDMLYSIILKLAPTRQATVRATMGHQAHAAFLRTVRESDPALAEVLHLPNLPRRPFTVSPLLGVSRARDGEVRLSPEQDYFLRFTILYPPIFERFMARFLHGDARPTIRLGRAELLIREILTTPGSHPWAGYTTAGELRAGAGTDRRIRLVFASPTAFSVGRTDDGKKRRMVVFPQPELVWASLRGSWNALTDDEISIEFERWVERNVVVREVRSWRTAMHRFRNGVQVGGCGDIVFEALDDDSVSLHTLNALADFSFYAGIGTKTTMGMGQTRRVVK